MSNKISETELLQKLDIPDWRHMSKEKVITFVSSMAYLDPEVAKKAMEQFPHFTKLGNEMITTMKASLTSAYEESSKGMEQSYKINMKILDCLDSQLNRRFLSKQSREKIINAMLEVSKNISDLENNHHNFLLNSLKTIGTVAVGICMIAGAAIGVVIKKHD